MRFEEDNFPIVSHAPRSKRRSARTTRTLLAVASLIIAISCGSGDEEERAVELMGLCTLNSDCEDPLRCAFARCHEECQASIDCPRGSRCVRSEVDDLHVCQLEDEIQCEDETDCNGDQICASDRECRDECEDEDECPEDQVCLADANDDEVCADTEELDEDGELPAASNDGGSGGNGGQGGNGGMSGDGSGGARGEVVSGDGEVTFSSDGGTYEITVEGDTVIIFNVPAGAVSEDTTVSASNVSSANLPEGWTALGEVYEVEAEAELDESVTIRVPFDADAEGTPQLAYLNEDGDWVILEDAEIDAEEGVAEASVATFGSFVVVSVEEFDCSTCGEHQVCQFNRCYDQCSDADPCADEATCCDVAGESICVNTDSDSNHCGACNVTCGTAENASEYGCNNGLCEVQACEERFQDCNGSPEDGCEANLDSDALNCGRCGDTCGAGAECIDAECETGLVDIAAGWRSTCVLRENGNVVCWGQIAGGSSQGRSPQLIPGVEDAEAIAVAGFNPDRAYAIVSGRPVSWANATEAEDPGVEPVTDVVRIAAGGGFACALLTGDLVSCWGTTNNYGQLGRGDSNPPENNNPQNIVNDAVAISVGSGQHACALHNQVGDGSTARCWGANTYGQIGDGANIGGTATSPTEVKIGTTTTEDFVDIAAGGDFTCGMRADGRVYCWGYGYYGQLGMPLEDIPDASGRSPEPLQVDGLTDVASLQAGFQHACALHTDGTVSCWGRNNVGQLGYPTENEAQSTVPTLVPGLDDVRKLTVGYYHACVLRESGPPVCWGQNNVGQLGDGSTSERPSPVQVANLP